MKYYIATTLKNAHRAQLVRSYLKKRGHQFTYDWTIHGAVGHLGPEVLEDVAAKEMFGVLTADVVIVLLPGGKGTHCELGMAMAMGKPIIIWDEPNTSMLPNNDTCSFYWLPGIKQRFGGALTPDAIELLVRTAEEVSIEEKMRRAPYVVR